MCLNGEKIGNHFDSKAGVVTGKDDYFLRYWHEISFPEFDLYAKDTSSKYVPFSKGGSFVKWYGNIVYAIKLADLWNDAKVNKSVRRGDQSAYFKRCIGWSYMGGGNKKNFCSSSAFGNFLLFVKHFTVSNSSLSKVPSSPPASSIKTISSSDTVSLSSFGFTPNKRRTAFVETLKNQIIGFKMTVKTVIIPHAVSASFSLCFIAQRLGTSSPNTSVK